MRARSVRRFLIPVLGLLAALAVAAPLEAVPGVGGFRVLYEADSVYHRIVVVEDNQARYLRFDRSVQSGMYLRDPFDSPFLYGTYAHLGLAFRSDARRTLVVGLGGGSIPKRFWRDYPAMGVDVAELDPMVVEVARRFFSLPEDPRLQVTVQDGRLFIRRTSQLYDLIVLDAYFAESIPFHLTTREFLRQVRLRLSPGGVVVANIIGALTGPRSRLFRAMYRTTADVFPGVYPFPVAFRPYEDVETIRNVMVVASAEGGLRRAEILERAARVAARVTYPSFRQYAADYYDAPIRVDDVPLLTDDYAPVDTLIPVYRGLPPSPP